MTRPSCDIAANVISTYNEAARLGDRQTALEALAAYDDHLEVCEACAYRWRSARGPGS